MLSTCRSCVGTWQAYRTSILITLCVYVQQGYAFGRICLCVYVCTCIWPLENPSILYYLLAEFKHLQCGFLHSPCCTDLAIHASSNKTQRSPSLQIFYSELTAPLGSAIAGAAVAPVVCFSKCFSSCVTTAILLLFYTCMQWHFRLDLWRDQGHILL